MIAKERPPALGWRVSSLGHAGLSDIDADLEEFSMDRWSRLVIGNMLGGQSPRHRRTFPQSRFPSLEAFGRRPRRQLHRRDGPSSETLHTFGPTHRMQLPAGQ